MRSVLSKLFAFNKPFILVLAIGLLEDAGDAQRTNVVYGFTTMDEFLMSAPLIRDHMLVDPAFQQKIVRRVEAGNFSADQPDQAADSLGSIALPDGKRVSVYLRHAADPVLLDCAGLCQAAFSTLCPTPKVALALSKRSPQLYVNPWKRRGFPGKS
jgi:hypothetical protein